MEYSEDFVEQLINPFIIDRLTDVYQKSEEYQKCLNEEKSLYEKLSKGLREEQGKLTKIPIKNL